MDFLEQRENVYSTLNEESNYSDFLDVSGVDVPNNNNNNLSTRPSLGIDTVSGSLDSINNGLLNDVKLMPTTDISMVPGESPMFNNLQEFAVKGIHEETGLSTVYFSQGNVALLQAAIRQGVYSKTNKIVDKQSPQELSIVMRSIYLQEGNPMVSSKNLSNEIRKLNEKVIDYCVKSISVNVLQYDGYLDKLTSLPVPMEHPRQVDKNNFTYDISNLL